MAHDFKRFPELTNSQMQIYYLDSPHKQLTEDFTAKVVKVTDGDTIRVTMDERNFSFPIRFINTAAPELDEQGGIAAKNWLETQILGEMVEVVMDESRRVEKWGRLLGEIVFLGTSINDLSIDMGHAVQWEAREVPLW